MKKLAFSLMLLVSCHSWGETLEKEILQQFLADQQGLQSAIQRYCSAPGETNSAVLKQWQKTAISWYQVSALQLPATEFMQTHYTFVFWPDAKDRLKNQVYAALKNAPDDIDQSELASAVTSLSAIEFILTDAATTRADAFANQCAWMSYIAEYQVSQSSQLAELQAFYDFDESEWLNALHGTTLVALDQLNEISARENRLIWQLGPAWRSDTTWQIQYSLSQQLTALIDMFIPKDEELQLWQNQLAELELAEQTPSLETVLTYRAFLARLGTYIENDLATKLDIFLGFNNFDGD